jgi:hypothetical protein
MHVCRNAVLVGLLLGIAQLVALGQNPVPFVNQPLVPTAVPPGGPGFTLTVNGTGFVPGSVVQWNGSPRPTTFVSNSQLSAAIPATDTTTIGSASVTVVSPAPGGGVSNEGLFLITFPSPSVTFKQTDFGTGGGAVAIATADFNGDGKADIAVLRDYEVLVFLGNGDGTFQNQLPYPTGGSSGSAIRAGMVAADFNKDGKIDLAVANDQSSSGSNQGSISVLIGNGDGTFQPALNYPLVNFIPVAMVCADFNRDGVVDVALAGYNADVGEVDILLGNGDGTFIQGSTSTYGDYIPHSIAVGDFNGDGELDLAVTFFISNVSESGYYYRILFGDGNGGFNPGPFTGGVVGTPLTVADLNGDGKLDLAISYTSTFREVYSVVYVLLGNGDGTFGPPVAFRIGYMYSNQVIPSDLNGDVKLDLASAGHWGVSALLGNGDGTFQSPATINLYPSMIYSLSAADFDGDGRVDLATGNYDSPSLSVFMQPSPVDLDPGGLPFGDQRLGTPSSSRTATLTNNLTGPLTISSIALTGANTDDFTETHDCPLSPSTLAAGGSCTISVTFFHTTLGDKTAAITVSDDASGYPQQVLNLSGSVIDPVASLSSTILNFGNQPIDVTSAPQTVTLTNSGSGTLTILGIAVTGDFAETNNCGTRLAQGAQCTISFTFMPTNPGIRFGTVTITDNAATGTETMSLTGTGVPPTITLSATSLTFGDQKVHTTSAPQTVTLTNNGPGPLTVNVIGNQSNDFSVGSTCVGTVAASASCTISVTFTPQENGTRTGTVTINDNAVGSLQTVSLTGTGLGPLASVSPSSLNFPDQPIGTTSSPQVATLTNNGAGTMSLSGIYATSPFGATTGCKATLSAGASCASSVTFTSLFAGMTYGSLTISDDAPGSPHTVSLTGSTAVDFPAQTVGTTSAPQTVTLANPSGSPRAILGITTAGDFAASSNCGNLPAGGSCSVSVTFKPTMGGTRVGSLLVADDQPGSPHAVTLSGAGMDFALTVSSGSPTSKSINAGQTATYALIIDPISGFKGSLTLACSGAPSLGTCAASPGSVALDGTTPANVTVAVTTTAPSASAPQLRVWPPGLRNSFYGLLSLWLMVLMGLTIRIRRSHVHVRIGALSGSILLVALLYGACGSGGSMPRQPTGGTPSGAYTITVTGTATTSAGTLIRNLALTLRVN